MQREREKKEQAEKQARIEEQERQRKQQQAAQQAEQQAREKAEAQAKARAEAQAQAKADADAKAKAEAQAKAQAQAKADAQAKAEADAKAKAAAAAEAKAKAAEDEKRKQAAAKAQAEKEAKAQAAQQEKDRQANIARMAALAGGASGSGSPDSRGTAAQSSGPSSSYGGKVAARVRPNIVFPDNIAGNPRAEVEVRTAPDGTILGRRLVRSSGNTAWDEAVLRAVDRTQSLPRDEGRPPPSPLVIGFRPND